jgi:eIF-2B alpha/beta/delta-like uncharacterized protein
MVDMSKYNDVNVIHADIQSVVIQGATNVAIATLHGLKLVAGSFQGSSTQEFLAEIRRVGELLSRARANEPLATNGVKYVIKHLPADDNLKTTVEEVERLSNQFLDLIEDSKKRIIEVSKGIGEFDEVFTHCHSSTAESVIIDMAKGKDYFKVLCTETRPLYQGHKTAKNLVGAGIDTTLIVDSTAESFIIGRGEFNIDVIFIGADEITMHGDAVNKVGSWGIALAGKYAKKPLYVITPLLKANPDTASQMPQIEKREPKEVWDDAPEGLKMYNPSFDLVNAEFITGYITEAGLLKPQDIAKTLRNNYEWVF